MTGLIHEPLFEIEAPSRRLLTVRQRKKSISVLRMLLS